MWFIFDKVKWTGEEVDWLEGEHHDGIYIETLKKSAECEEKSFVIFVTHLFKTLEAVITVKLRLTVTSLLRAHFLATLQKPPVCKKTLVISLIRPHR